MLKDVLENALGKGLTAQGFTLNEPDDHTLELRHRGELICRMPVSHSSPSIGYIKNECLEHIVAHHTSEFINGGDKNV